MKSGVLDLYKEKGMTSAGAVDRIRRLFGTKKVGHTGTLDPQATGVLPILIGNAVKAAEFVTAGMKTYRAKVKFGIFTDTEDIWGKVIKTDEKRVPEDVFRTASESFSGEYYQMPPMMSAVKIGGKKLYEYFREGKTVERQARRCFIYSVSVSEYSSESAVVTLECSKGTYVRTFIRDVCEKCGICGTMSELERLTSGAFSLNGAVRLSELEVLSEEEREALLLPTESLFSDFEKLTPAPFFVRLIKNGCRVDTQKLGIAHPEKGKRYRLYGENGFFGIGEILFEDGIHRIAKIKDFSEK